MLQLAALHQYIRSFNDIEDGDNSGLSMNTYIALKTNNIVHRDLLTSINSAISIKFSKLLTTYFF